MSVSSYVPNGYSLRIIDQNNIPIKMLGAYVQNVQKPKDMLPKNLLSAPEEVTDPLVEKLEKANDEESVFSFMSLPDQFDLQGDDVIDNEREFLDRSASL